MVVVANISGQEKVVATPPPPSSPPSLTTSQVKAQQIDLNAQQLTMMDAMLQETVQQLDHPQMLFHRFMHFGREMLGRTPMKQVEIKLANEIDAFRQNEMPKIAQRIEHGESFAKICDEYPLLTRARKQYGFDFSNIRTQEDALGLWQKVVEFYRNTRDYRAVEMMSQGLLREEIEAGFAKISEKRAEQIITKAQKETEQYFTDHPEKLAGRSEQEQKQLTGQLLQTTISSLAMKEALSNLDLSGAKLAIWKSYRDCLDPLNEISVITDSNSHFVGDWAAKTGGAAALAGLAAYGASAATVAYLTEAVGAVAGPLAVRAISFLIPTLASATVFEGVQGHAIWHDSAGQILKTLALNAVGLRLGRYFKTLPIFEKPAAEVVDAAVPLLTAGENATASSGLVATELLKQLGTSAARYGIRLTGESAGLTAFNQVVSRVFDDGTPHPGFFEEFGQTVATLGVFRVVNGAMHPLLPPIRVPQNGTGPAVTPNNPIEPITITVNGQPIEILTRPVGENHVGGVMSEPNFRTFVTEALKASGMSQGAAEAAAKNIQAINYTPGTHPTVDAFLAGLGLQGAFTFFPAPGSGPTVSATPTSAPTPTAQPSAPIALRMPDAPRMLPASNGASTTAQPTVTTPPSQPLSTDLGWAAAQAFGGFPGIPFSSPLPPIVPPSSASPVAAPATVTFADGTTVTIPGGGISFAASSTDGGAGAGVPDDGYIDVNSPTAIVRHGVPESTALSGPGTEQGLGRPNPPPPENEEFKASPLDEMRQSILARDPSHTTNEARARAHIASSEVYQDILSNAADRGIEPVIRESLDTNVRTAFRDGAAVRIAAKDGLALSDPTELLAFAQEFANEGHSSLPQLLIQTGDPNTAGPAAISLCRLATTTKDIITALQEVRTNLSDRAGAINPVIRDLSELSRAISQDGRISTPNSLNGIFTQAFHLGRNPDQIGLDADDKGKANPGAGKSPPPSSFPDPSILSPWWVNAREEILGEPANLGVTARDQVRAMRVARSANPAVDAMMRRLGDPQGRILQAAVNEEFLQAFRDAQALRLAANNPSPDPLMRLARQFVLQYTAPERITFNGWSTEAETAARFVRNRHLHLIATQLQLYLGTARPAVEANPTILRELDLLAGQVGRIVTRLNTSPDGVIMSPSGAAGAANPNADALRIIEERLQLVTDAGRNPEVITPKGKSGARIDPEITDVDTLIATAMGDTTFKPYGAKIRVAGGGEQIVPVIGAGADVANALVNGLRDQSLPKGLRIIVVRGPIAINGVTPPDGEEVAAARNISDHNCLIIRSEFAESPDGPLHILKALNNGTVTAPLPKPGAGAPPTDPAANTDFPDLHRRIYENRDTGNGRSFRETATGAELRIYGAPNEILARRVAEVLVHEHLRGNLLGVNEVHWNPELSGQTSERLGLPSDIHVRGTRQEVNGNTVLVINPKDGPDQDMNIDRIIRDLSNEDVLHSVKDSKNDTKYVTDDPLFDLANAARGGYQTFEITIGRRDRPVRFFVAPGTDPTVINEIVGQFTTLEGERGNKYARVRQVVVSPETPRTATQESGAGGNKPVSIRLSDNGRILVVDPRIENARIALDEMHHDRDRNHLLDDGGRIRMPRDRRLPDAEELRRQLFAQDPRAEDAFNTFDRSLGDAQRFYPPDIETCRNIFLNNPGLELILRDRINDAIVNRRLTADVAQGIYAEPHYEEAEPVRDLTTLVANMRRGRATTVTTPRGDFALFGTNQTTARDTILPALQAVVDAGGRGAQRLHGVRTIYVTRGLEDALSATDRAPHGVSQRPTAMLINAGTGLIIDIGPGQSEPITRALLQIANSEGNIGYSEAVPENPYPQYDTRVGPISLPSGHRPIRRIVSDTRANTEPTPLEARPADPRRAGTGVTFNVYGDLGGITDRRQTGQALHDYVERGQLRNLGSIILTDALGRTGRGRNAGLPAMPAGLREPLGREIFGTIVEERDTRGNISRTLLVNQNFGITPGILDLVAARDSLVQRATAMLVRGVPDIRSFAPTLAFDTSQPGPTRNLHYLFNFEAESPRLTGAAARAWDSVTTTDRNFVALVNGVDEAIDRRLSGARRGEGNFTEAQSLTTVGDFVASRVRVIGSDGRPISAEVEQDQIRQKALLHSELRPDYDRLPAGERDRTPIFGGALLEPDVVRDPADRGDQPRSTITPQSRALLVAEVILAEQRLGKFPGAVQVETQGNEAWVRYTSAVDGMETIIRFDDTDPNAPRTIVERQDQAPERFTFRPGEDPAQRVAALRVLPFVGEQGLPGQRAVSVPAPEGPPGVIRAIADQILPWRRRRP